MLVDRRRRLLFTAGVALALATGCSSPASVDQTGPDAKPPSFDVTTQVSPEWGPWAACVSDQPDSSATEGVPDLASGIDGVLKFEVGPSGLADGCPEYLVSPPVGGKYSSEVANCGFYQSPVPAPPGVQSLRNGSVWITFDPDLDVESLAVVADATARASHVLASPYPGIEHPVVLSAWGRQLALESVKDPRFDEFLNTFVQGRQTPNVGGACHEGRGDPAVRFR